MKHDTFDKYPRGGLELAQRALLTTWDCLSNYREDLVLVGGLAVRHLTRRAEKGLADAVTLDVDFGISIGTSGGMYGSIRQTLSSHGFEWNGQRFNRVFGTMELFVDLLTDDGQATVGTVIVDDGLSVSLMPGISRALECNRTLDISGTTLLGAETRQRVRVAEVGPLLVLKLNAFAGRRAPKDAHDVVYLAMNYLDGVEKAVAGFAEEKAAGNRGMLRALHTLESDFRDADAAGPVSCAAFRMTNEHQSPERSEESRQLREQCVTLAKALLT